jgi:2-polyprenyl-3-methyl-5-hydroxy-6-metoxy-1,4-benzoquinol methylase
MAELSQYSSHFFDPDSLNNSWANMYSYIPAGSRVLDVGCSTGNFGEALEQLKGCTVVGIDINADDIEVAAGRISAAHVFDITAQDAAEVLGSFDVIVFADVIEHLGDPRAALTAVHALLNPSGVIVYSIPNMGHASVRLDLLEGRFPYAELGLLDRTHLHYYDRAEVNDVLASAGFSIADERPTVSEYPRQWVSQRLNALGLTANSSFFDMLRVTEAHVYQYVGKAIPVEEAPALPPASTRFVSPPDEILERANLLLEHNQELVDQNEEQARENDRVRALAAETQRELDELRAWAAQLKHNPARAVAASLKRRLAGR